MFFAYLKRQHEFVNKPASRTSFSRLKLLHRGHQWSGIPPNHTQTGCREASTHSRQSAMSLAARCATSRPASMKQARMSAPRRVCTSCSRPQLSFLKPPTHNLITLSHSLALIRPCALIFLRIRFPGPSTSDEGGIGSTFKSKTSDIDDDVGNRRNSRFVGRVEPQRRDPREHVERQLLAVRHARRRQVQVSGRSAGAASNAQQLLVETGLLHHRQPLHPASDRSSPSFDTSLPSQTGCVGLQYSQNLFSISCTTSNTQNCATSPASERTHGEKHLSL